MLCEKWQLKIIFCHETQFSAEEFLPSDFSLPHMPLSLLSLSAVALRYLSLHPLLPIDFFVFPLLMSLSYLHHICLSHPQCLCSIPTYSAPTQPYPTTLSPSLLPHLSLILPFITLSCPDSLVMPLCPVLNSQLQPSYHSITVPSVHALAINLGKRFTPADPFQLIQLTHTHTQLAVLAKSPIHFCFPLLLFYKPLLFSLFVWKCMVRVTVQQPFSHFYKKKKE